MTDYYSGPNRYVCSVLEEMRECLKYVDSDNLYRYISHMKMMIEEAQTLVNIMESALSDWNDLCKLKKKRSKLKRQVKALEDKLEEIKQEYKQ